MPIYSIPPVLSCIGLIGLGLFILTRNRHNVINISFSVAIFGLALMEGSYALLLVTKNVLWTKTAILGACIIPGSVTTFSLTFARENSRESLKHWKYVLGSILLLSLWFLYLGLSGSLLTKTMQLSFSQFEIYEIQPAGLYFLIFLLGTLLIILHNLENTYRTASRTTRWKIKFLIVGIFSTGFFHIFLISFMLLYKIVRVEYFVAEAVIVLISGLLVAFSLVRHRLMDTDVFISRQVVYNSFVLLFAGAYLITIATIGYLVKYRLIDQEVTQFLVAEIFMYVALVGMVILLLSEEVRRRIELYISKHFYKHKYEYDEVWIDFTRRLGSQINLDTLLPQLVRLLQGIINTDHVWIFLVDDRDEYLELAASSVPQPREVRFDKPPDLVAYFIQASTPQNAVLRMPLPPAFPAESREIFKTLGIRLCAPLLIKETFLGLIAIGAERTGEPYSHEDDALLYTIGMQAASVILNAQLSEDLSEARALETFHKFTTFILHDLKNAVQSLSFVVQNAPDYFDDPEFRQDAITTIADTVTRMNTMITKLSSVPETLDLYLTDTHLESLIADTLKTSKVSKLDHIHITTDLPDPSLALPLDYQHMQSVFINLLSNAAESITDSGEITLRALQLDHTIEISISDTGCGIPPDQLKTLFTPFQSTKKKGLGIGLYQCKTIVEAHGGKISVESEEGRGTIFRLEFPRGPNESKT
ncbi:PEP-CTERM system histidine kinase PrsK [candidate division KSB3 bacterium]|uniref:histidine kinase n=1 Tax=candidate division KSB3 bacterium TaxID=2044937 RepID=A0A9D5JSG3_9BACT|nr:PEP-CTERM system histidine kinase PrsK [candidate division KSB3 bacterium]MBD3323167.1 PEP-CTERM system histidine kinase PrsK [candidate division KSB3 bacterium]